MDAPLASVTTPVMAASVWAGIDIGEDAGSRISNGLAFTSRTPSLAPLLLIIREKENHNGRKKYSGFRDISQPRRG
jgi:hypothetical protein